MSVFADVVGITVTPNSWDAGKAGPAGTLRTWGANTPANKGFFKVTNVSTAAVGVRLLGTNTTPTPGTKPAWTLGTTTGATQYTIAWGTTATVGVQPTWNAIQLTTATTLGGSGYTIASAGSYYFDLRVQLANDATNPPADYHTMTINLIIDATTSAVAGKWFYSPSANAYFTNIGSANMAYSNSGSSGTLTWNRNASEATIDSTGFTNLYNDGIIQYLDYTWSPSYTYHSTWDGYPDYTHRLNYYNYLGTYNYSYTHYNGLSSPQWVKSLVPTGQ